MYQLVTFPLIYTLKIHEYHRCTSNKIDDFNGIQLLIVFSLEL